MSTLPLRLVCLISCFNIFWAKPLNSKVFLLVLDGFIHDYDKLSTEMPNFAKLAKEGVKGKGLIPPFPSSTWPSMNTLSTGLYPESHGLINNDFYDEAKETMFHWKGDPKDYEKNARFYTQEPIWLTNQKQKGTSSVYYWPGYYSFPEKPKYYNKNITPYGANITSGQQAIDDTFTHLQSDPSLNFMVVYVDAPDETGHEHGVHSEYKKRLEALDKNILGYLLEKLEPHPDINLVVVADHGMIDVDQKKIFFLADYLTNGTYLEHPHCSSMCSVMPANGHSTEELIKKLSPLQDTGGMRIFSKDNQDPNKRFPEHLHYAQSKLIPPILILPDPGWILFDQRLDQTDRTPRLGTHGYDAVHVKEMRTIFFARGPAFKKGVTIKPFENVNIAPLLAHLLGVKARPNNGSLSTFKNVLAKWDPAEKIDIHGNYSTTTYGFVFVGGILASLIILAAIYFSLMHCYWSMCKRNVNYVKVDKNYS